MTSTGDPLEEISSFLYQTEVAAQELSAGRNTMVSAVQVREALVAACKVEQQVDLLPLALLSSGIRELLDSFDFQGLPVHQEARMTDRQPS